MIRHSASRWVSAALVGAAAVLTLALLAAPLPFGGIVPPAATALRLAGFVALGLAAFSLTRTPRDTLTSRGSTPVPWLPVFALAALGGLAALQSLPWPVSIVEALSPEHARVWRDARGMVDPGRMSPPTFSLAPAVSRHQAWAWLSLAAAFLAAAAVGRRRLLRRALAAAVVATALFEVLYGARRWLVHATTIWGVEVPGLGTRLRGTFVNPNHLATSLEMALPVLFAWGWFGVRRARHEDSPEGRLLWIAPPVLLGLTVLAGLAFTASRGGLAGGVAGLVTMAVLSAIDSREGRHRRTGRRRWRQVPVTLTITVAALGVVGLVGFQEAFGRMTATSLYEVGWGARTLVYRATLALWWEFPLFGTGLGSFREAFPRVQPAELPGTWLHAHSDPLELLATGGVVAVVLAVVGGVALVLRLSRGLRRGVRTEDRAAALAGLGIFVSLLVHEALDFGLTMPANAFTAAVLLGAASCVRTRPAPNQDSHR